MKKLLLFSFILTAFTSFTLNAQVKCGIKIGADFSTLQFRNNGTIMNDSAEFKGITSPRLGFFLEVPFTDEFFLNAGFEGAIKGYSFESVREKNNEWVSSQEKALLLAVNFPIMAGYKYDLGSAKLFGMLGPVIGINTYATNLYKAGGKWDNSHMFIGEWTLESGESPMAYFKRMDMLVRLEAGIEVHRFQFSASYTQGLSDLQDIEDGSVTSRIIGLNAAIKFGSMGKRGRWR